MTGRWAAGILGICIFFWVRDLHIEVQKLTSIIFSSNNLISDPTFLSKFWSFSQPQTHASDLHYVHLCCPTSEKQGQKDHQPVIAVFAGSSTASISFLRRVIAHIMAVFLGFEHPWNRLGQGGNVPGPSDQNGLERSRRQRWGSSHGDVALHRPSENLIGHTFPIVPILLIVLKSASPSIVNHIRTFSLLDPCQESNR